jgi:nicotinamidase-related amidase
MKEQALLIIDMVHDFMAPDGALYCGRRDIVPAAAALLRRHRDLGSLIIFAQDQHTPDDLEFTRFPPHCVAGQPGAATIPELAPQAGEIILGKRRFSAFFETDLADILQKNQVREVHLCGVCTSICVMDTCSGLRDRDYEVLAYVPAMADFDPQAHEFALKRMETILGARMVDSI